MVPGDRVAVNIICSGTGHAIIPDSKPPIVRQSAIRYRYFGITTIDTSPAIVADCRVGGGIRTIEKAEKILKLGAKKIIIGTKANYDFLRQLPKDKLIVAIDTKKGKIVNKGWTTYTDQTPQKMIKELENLCSGFLFTNVDREGLMQGLDFEIVKELVSLTNNKLTIAGGITSLEDIGKLEELGVDSQVGMAIYTGKIDLEEAFLLTSSLE